jgi:plasmid stabilization system protein ParE
MKLRLLPEALARIDAGRAWWIGHRDKAPALFDEELADALERALAAPSAGQRVAITRGRSVRRVLMPKTAFHVYYEVLANEVQVLTIWGARRGDRPNLG